MCELVTACRTGRKSEVERLLCDPNVDPTINNNKPLRVAVMNGHVDIIQLLVNDKRVDPSTCNNIALRIASDKCYYDETEVIRKLLMSDHRVHKTSRDNESLLTTMVDSLSLLDPYMIPSLSLMVCDFIVPRCRVGGCQWKY